MNIASATFYMRALPGENPGTFALESAMDELSILLKMDPIELRLANYADKAPAQRTAFLHQKFKGVLPARRRKIRPEVQNVIRFQAACVSLDGARMGWGMATATPYPAHRFPNQARIRLQLDRDGGLSAVGAAATQDLGTGAYTVCTQMTAMLTDLPFERVKFELGDTNLPPGGVSGGSSTTAGVGQALSEAAEKLRQAVFRSWPQDKSGSPLAGLTKANR